MRTQSIEERKTVPTGCRGRTRLWNAIGGGGGGGGGVGRFQRRARLTGTAQGDWGGRGSCRGPINVRRFHSSSTRTTCTSVLASSSQFRPDLPSFIQFT